MTSGMTGPGRLVGQPLVGPGIVALPVHRPAGAPDAESAVVQHDRLTDLVADANILRRGERDTEMAAGQRVQNRPRADGGAVVVDRHAERPRSIAATTIAPAIFSASITPRLNGLTAAQPKAME